MLPMLKDDGISQTDAIRGESQAVAGQAVLERHYAADTTSPAIVIAPEGAYRQVAEAAGAVDGVTGVEPLGSPPKVVDGRVLLRAGLEHGPDTEEAVRTVRELREAVRQAAPEALVGGRAASELDTRETSARDLYLIVPVVLAVITLVLAVLLRSLLAPLLLIVTVTLSLTATLGVSALVFNEVFEFPGGDPGTVLLGFVFLVALGVDYNIFLMTRAREESARIGTRDGVLRALAVTGGVITSAGLVLAATFGALAVLPLLILVQIAFIVAFGVLLDTLVVRSLLVPALVRVLGDRTWWPSALSRGEQSRGEQSRGAESRSES
jgi:RND superfamily putative drug exporter